MERFSSAQRTPDRTNKLPGTDHVLVSREVPDEELVIAVYIPQ